MLRQPFSLPFSIALLSQLVIGGCSRQAEGERCSLSNGNDDCEGNLICTNATLLRQGDDEVDRCCPENLETTKVSECARRTASGNDGAEPDEGAGGAPAAGAGGAAADGDPPDLGDGCDYNSDCGVPLVCGPGGVCQYECNQDRDCPSGQLCTDERSCE